MDWTVSLSDRLHQQPIGGYHARQLAATEPTALAALALLAAGRPSSARRAGAWLASCQMVDGSVGVRNGEPEPRWPTSLAAFVWAALDTARERDQTAARSTPPNAATDTATAVAPGETGAAAGKTNPAAGKTNPAAGKADAAAAERANAAESRSFALHREQAIQWIVGCRGSSLQRDPEMGHDTTLVAWPWVEGTHSWLEPTALCVLALKACGHAQHPRTREAVRCLIDRQLADGGCNYGNTLVLGQALRPHVQPTGLAMLALAGETDAQGRIEKSLDWLAAAIEAQSATASLCYGLLGLAAHRRSTPRQDELLAAAAERTLTRDPSTYRIALLLLASQGERSPLVLLPRDPKRPSQN